MFEEGHGHGPNTNMANGLGNPTASLIEAGSPKSSGGERGEREIRNSKGEGETGDRVKSKI